MIIFSLLLAAASPSAEAFALGRHLSESGSLAALLTTSEQKDLAEMVTRNPSMSKADMAALEATTKQVYAAEKERLFDAEARSFANQMTVEDMRALVAFSDTALATHLREKMPAIIIGTISQVGQIDLGAAIRKVYCEGREKQPLCTR